MPYLKIRHVRPSVRIKQHGTYWTEIHGILCVSTFLKPSTIIKIW
jgi:hypothetical protein